MKTLEARRTLNQPCRNGCPAPNDPKWPFAAGPVLALEARKRTPVRQTSPCPLPFMACIGSALGQGLVKIEAHEPLAYLSSGSLLFRDRTGGMRRHHGRARADGDIVAHTF